MEAVILNHIALIVCALGLLIWMFCIRLLEPPKELDQVGKIMFWTGLLAVLLGK